MSLNLNLCNLLGRSLFLSCLLFVGCSKPSIKWTSSQSKPTESQPVLKVFLENSVSMDGFMCAGSELKDAVGSYVSAMKQYSDTTMLYYISQNPVPCHDNLQNFIWNLTPVALRNAGGNRAHSEIHN